LTFLVFSSVCFYALFFSDWHIELKPPLLSGSQFFGRGGRCFGALIEQPGFDFGAVENFNEPRIKPADQSARATPEIVVLKICMHILAYVLNNGCRGYAIAVIVDLPPAAHNR